MDFFKPILCKEKLIKNIFSYHIIPAFLKKALPTFPMTKKERQIN